MRPARRPLLALVACAMVVGLSASIALAAPGDLDDDGVLDTFEDANADADGDPATNPGPDLDGDLTPDYLDPDDDDDGIPTLSENADPNGDGDPRDALDADFDGQPDWRDAGAIDPTAGFVIAEQRISSVAGGLVGPIDNTDRFGHGLAGVGDLDGDGVNDLAATAYYDGDGGSGHGAVYILFLNADGTVRAEQKISDTVGGLVAPLDDLDWFGFDVAAPGDLDGDGIGDLAVGAVYDDDGGTDRGAVYILFLNADGTVRAEQKISDTAGGLVAALDDSDGFGHSVAAPGDLDGDGLGDLAVGTYDDDTGTNTGAVHILFLNADGTVRAEQKISPLAGGGPPLSGADLFGSSVAGVGDIDADGVGDLVVGADGDDDGGARRGSVYVLFMNADGTVRTHQKISQLSGGKAAFLHDYTSFGSAVAGVGDLDGDGVPDVAVGADSDDGGGNARGAVFILFLQSDGTVKREYAIRDGGGGLATPLDDTDRFGNGVASLGDLGGDGTLDLAVGAWQAEAGGFSRGEVFVLNLGPSSATVNSSGDGADATPGDHRCDTGGLNADGDPECTLRAAIEEANASPSVDRIDFKIPNSDPGHVYQQDDAVADSLGAPVTTALAEAAITDFDPDYPTTPFSWWNIAVAGSLPTVTEAVAIDGTTQPGWRANTGVGGAPTDAVLPVVVRSDSSASLFTFAGTGSVLRGVNASGGNGSATAITLAGTGGHTIEGSWAQIGPLGITNDALGDIGIDVGSGSDGNTIGGPDPADRVVIGNGYSHAAIDARTNNSTIQNVWIGAQVTGDALLPGYNDVPFIITGNDNVLGTPGAGIVVSSALNDILIITGDRNTLQASSFGFLPDGTPSAAEWHGVTGTDNLIGGVNPGEGNRFNGTGNPTSPVLSISGGTGNSVLGNSYTSAPGLVLNIGPAGPEPNDPGDGDIGDNDLLNYPVITLVNPSDGTATVDFQLDVPAGNYRIEFYADDAEPRNPTGYGAGEVLVGSASITHTGSGVETFQATITDLGDYWLGATATEDFGGGDYGSTSEFGPTVCVGDSDGDGLCDGWEDANTDADDDPATSPGPDTDGDGDVNYLDADDDGDGIATSAERADPDGDGHPRNAWDSDRDGEVDYLDPPTIRTEATPTTITKLSAFGGGVAPGPAGVDVFGAGLTAVGDLDGNGTIDLAAGDPFADDGGTDRGAVTVLFLEPDGRVRAQQRIAHLTGGGPTLADGDDFGASVAGLGDVDGDGVGDLAVGASGDADAFAGAVWILLLNPDGTARETRKISALTGDLTQAPVSGDRFGIAVTGLGDLDRDGVNDLVVGADRSDDGSWDWGAVHVLFLNADGSVKADTKISAVAGGLTHTFDPGVDEEFGSSVAGLGDVDGDGVPDIAVGSVRYSGEGSQRGAVHVLFLNADGSVKAEQRISDATGGLTTPLQNSGWFGGSVSGIGDLDLDGVPDLMVGAENMSVNNIEDGAAFVLLLNPDGTVKSERVLDASLPAMTFALDGGDHFGSAVAGLGDLNGDGYIDVAVGATDDGDGIAGAVYLFQLAPGDLVVNSTGDAPDANPGDRICDTGGFNAEGAPECTLRAAIAELNASGGFPEILFDIPATDAGHAAGTWTISPGSALPTVLVGVTIDGTSQPGWTADPVVVLDGASAPPATGGLVVAAADPGSILGLRIVGFPGNGITVTGSGDTAIVGNRIHGSGGLGIDLGDDGVTLNDIGDADAGPNDLLNAPDVHSARLLGPSTVVTFDLDVPANPDGYLVEFFTNPAGPDPTGHGEGEQLIGTTIVAPGTGHSVTLAGASPDVVTATATAIRGTGYGPTSEFSRAEASNVWPVPGGAAVDRTNLDTDAVALTFPASDPDDASLTWSAVGLPAGLSIAPATGAVTGTFEPLTADRAHPVQIVVSDARGGTATWDFTWTVTAVNDPPSIEPITPPTVDEQTTLVLQPVATDPEDHTLRFRLDAGPDGATIDAATGRITWTPGEADGPGLYTITITAIDDGSPALSATSSFGIDVAEVNRAPVLTSPGRRTVTLGDEISLRLTARDDDLPADTLRFSLVAGPPGLELDPVSGTVRWSTADASPGVFRVIVEVADDGLPELTDQVGFSIDVVDPRPSSLPFGAGPETVDDEATVAYRDEVVLDPLGNDLGDDLRVVSVDAPTGVTATLDDGLVRIELGPDVVGPVVVRYEVADGSGRTAIGTITLDVAVPELRAVDDRAGTAGSVPVTIDLGSNDVDEGQPLTYSVDSPSSGRIRDLGDGLVEFEPAEEFEGEARFDYTVSDRLGNSSTASVVVEVVTITLAESAGEALDIQLPPRSAPTAITGERLSTIDIAVGAIEALSALRISVPLVVGAVVSLLVFLALAWWVFAPGIVLAVTGTARDGRVGIARPQADRPFFRLRGDADLVWAPRGGGRLRRLIGRMRRTRGRTSVEAPNGTAGLAPTDRLVPMTDVYRPTRPSG